MTPLTRLAVLVILSTTLNTPAMLSYAAPSTQTGVQVNTADLFNQATSKAQRGDYSGAVDDLTRLLQFDPGSWRAYASRGDYRNALGDTRGASEDYAQVVRLNPTMVIEYSALGNARQRMGDLRGALDAYNDAQRIDPGDLIAYYGRAHVRAELGDLTGAIDDMTRALEINPNYGFAYNDRGSYRARLGDRQAAADDFTRALQANPSLAAAYRNRGTVHRQQGDLQGAVDDFTQALQIDPSGGAYFDRGLARSGLGDYTGAVSDYTQALRFDPDSSEAYNNRAVAYSRLGDLTAAIEDYSRSLQISPTATRYRNRGLARARSGDSAGAIADYTRALELDPNYADAAYSRGRLRASLGEMTGAAQDLERATALYADQGNPADQQRAIDARRGLETSSASIAPVVPAPDTALASSPSAETPAPRGSSEPAPATTVSLGRLLYRDDFSDATSGWSRQSDDPESRVIGYADGEYSVARLTTRSGWSSASRPREGFVDFQVEVDARLVAPTEGAFVFLGFRRQENGDHYALEVDPDDGTYRLVRHVNGGPSTTVIGRTRLATIEGGTAINRLGVRAQDTEIVLLINGQQAGRIRDDRFRQGALALGVGQRQEGTAEARFTNLVVTSID
jgi:tetratricopeptide (TPR) repeat protein